MNPEKKSYDFMHFQNRKDSKAGIPNQKKPSFEGEQP